MLISASLCCWVVSVRQVAVLGLYLSVLFTLYLVPLGMYSPCIKEAGTLGPAPKLIGHRGAPMVRLELVMRILQSSTSLPTSGDADVVFVCVSVAGSREYCDVVWEGSGSRRRRTGDRRDHQVLPALTCVSVSCSLVIRNTNEQKHLRFLRTRHNSKHGKVDSCVELLACNAKQLVILFLISVWNTENSTECRGFVQCIAHLH